MRAVFITVLVVYNVIAHAFTTDELHYVVPETIITNVTQYPDYVLIGLEYSAVFPDPEPFVFVERIEENVSLGPFFYYDYLLVMPLELFDTYGGLDGIDFEALAEQNGSCNTDETWQKTDNKCLPFYIQHYLVEDNCTVYHDKYYYEIKSISDDGITFKLQKRVLTDNDGEMQQIITY